MKNDFSFFIDKLLKGEVLQIEDEDGYCYSVVSHFKIAGKTYVNVAGTKPTRYADNSPYITLVGDTIYEDNFTDFKISYK